MHKVEFKTVVNNGIIEIPKNNPEIKNKEVKVIITWDEQPEKNIQHKIENIKKRKSLPVADESSGKKYTLQFSLEKIIAGKDKIYELKFPLLCTMEIEENKVCIENKMLGIYVFGATNEEAEQQFCEEFDYLYTRYNELSDDELTDDVIAIKSFLNHIVKK